MFDPFIEPFTPLFNRSPLQAVVGRAAGIALPLLVNDDSEITATHVPGPPPTLANNDSEITAEAA